MNVQEAIEKIEKRKSTLNGWEELTRNNAFNEALDIVRKIDEPEKPVVPKFVADLYESIKDDFEVGTYKLFYKLYNCDLDVEILYWFSCAVNKPIETLVKMKLYGYEVKKEKLYIARNKTTGEHLYFNNAKKRFESGSLLTSYVKNVKAYHHTQDKLEKLNYWGNSLFEFEEVEE